VLPDDILNATVRQFIAATAARSPTPGGGSVAALAGALAASLAEMSMQYTLGKKQFEAHRAEIAGAIDKLRKAAGLMQDLVYEDMAAYKLVGGFLKIPMEQRLANSEYLPAVVATIRAPQSVGGLALHILELCYELLPTCNPLLLSDLGAAAALAHATVHVAELNVLVNLRLLPNPQEMADTRQKIADSSLKADMIWHKVRDTLVPQL
jgi:formiminotetrahydrofolate cyclodeaminase